MGASKPVVSRRDPGAAPAGPGLRFRTALGAAGLAWGWLGGVTSQPPPLPDGATSVVYVLLSVLLAYAVVGSARPGDHDDVLRPVALPMTWCLAMAFYSVTGWIGWVAGTLSPWVSGALVAWGSWRISQLDPHRPRWQPVAPRRRRPVAPGETATRIAERRAGMPSPPPEDHLDLDELPLAPPELTPQPGAACPYCAVALGGPALLVCRLCHTPHHADCWREGGGCTTYGCRARPRDALRVDPAPEAERGGEPPGGGP